MGWLFLLQGVSMGDGVSGGAHDCGVGVPPGQGCRSGGPVAGSVLSGGEVDLLREALERGADLSVLVDGECMLPVLSPGSRVLVRGCPLWEVVRGDLVLVCGGDGRLLVHRVVRVLRGGRGVVTKGDRRFRTDGVIGPDDYLGRVCWVEGGGAAGSGYDPRCFSRRVGGLVSGLVGGVSNLRFRLLNR